MFRKMIGRAGAMQCKCAADVSLQNVFMTVHALAGLSTVPQLTSTQSGCSN